MGYRGAIATCVALALLALTSCVAGAAPSSLTYYVSVAANGNATVVMVFTSNVNGTFYTFVPRFELWNVTVWKGTVIGRKVENTSAYFYYNATFKYLVDASGIFGMNISFTFPFASLYAGDRGWFMTPLLGAPPDTVVTVVVTIEGLGRVLDVSLNGVPVPYNVEGDVLRIRSVSLSLGGSRVTVDYRPANPVEETTMEFDANGTLVKVRAAPYYKGLARTVAGVVGRAMPYFRGIFSYSPLSVDFKLFLPTRMDLRALGYVMGEDINAGGEGPIHLNLALVRFKEGYLETTVIHELVHKALGALGIPANSELRWFHEGVAQYASVKICERLGIDVSDAKASLEEAIRIFGGGLAKPGFVQRWAPSGDEGSYYAASYYIVATVAEGRGGLSYIKRLASEIRRRGGVRTNQDLIEAMSAAAGEDLAPQFREWGFQVYDVKITTVPRLAVALAAVALAAAVGFSLLVILLWRRGGKRCPYCYGEVPRGAAYCPYCGYPLCTQDSKSLEDYSAS